MSQKLPFPLYAVVIGAIGMLMLAVSLPGIVGEPLLPILGEPTVAWALVALGGLLILVETVIIVFSLRARARR